MGLECLFFYHAIPSTVRNLYILDEIMNEEKGKKWRESLLEVKEVAERNRPVPSFLHTVSLPIISLYLYSHSSSPARYQLTASEWDEEWGRTEGRELTVGHIFNRSSAPLCL